MRLAILALLAALPGAAGAQDATAGAAAFERQCASCHVVVDDAGETLAGRRARTGPNLYGVAGRAPGTSPGFRYGAAMTAYGETGATWAEGNFVAYVQDPTGFLREALGDPRARGRMAHQVREAQDARDLWAYLAALAPPPAN